MDEPKDGDFVAYIERLQQESQARLLQGGLIANPSPGPHAGGSGHLFESGGEPRPVSRSEAEALLARLATSASFGRVLSAALPVATGALVLLYAIVAANSVFPFIIGVALLAYGVPRLRRTFSATPKPERDQARALVTEVFKRLEQRHGR
jgi:hypothetical protein